MDILNAGIVHSAAAPGLRVQGTFKGSAENGGADLRPVKVSAGLGQQQSADFFGERRNLNVLIGKKPAVR